MSMSKSLNLSRMKVRKRREERRIQKKIEALDLGPHKMIEYDRPDCSEMRERVAKKNSEMLKSGHEFWQRNFG